ncbi:MULTISPECIES: hypothetical protein [unclassified Bacillus (in: firmicutes)]|uniref:hypothetical protein n=1 Tax=unclassified Bacillus (in: firmicutes) TaxID=185979 RepID=UPI000B832601|nr:MULTISPECIES: hypothetical protein [unclassified Bacillus (in: firmicutes)]
MIVKNRTIPLRITMLQAILRWLPKNHPKRPSIEAELARREAGFRGEESIDDYLDFLPEK